jgi:membrane-associated phospholipid phosphatase
MLFIKVGAKSCPIKFSEQIKTAYESRARRARDTLNLLATTNLHSLAWRTNCRTAQPPFVVMRINRRASTVARANVMHLGHLRRNKAYKIFHRPVEIKFERSEEVFE